MVKIQTIWQQNAAFDHSETSIPLSCIIKQNCIPKTLDILSGPFLNQLSSDFQIWFWRSHSVHIRTWPWGPALWQRRDMPLPEVRSHFEGAGCWGCKALLGLYRAGHLLCVVSSHRLLYPPIQDQCWEIDSCKKWRREYNRDFLVGWESRNGEGLFPQKEPSACLPTLDRNLGWTWSHSMYCKCPAFACFYKKTKRLERNRFWDSTKHLPDRQRNMAALKKSHRSRHSAVVWKSNGLMCVIILESWNLFSCPCEKRSVLNCIGCAHVVYFKS